MTYIKAHSSSVGFTGCLFGPEELSETRYLIERAIREDLPGGDLTTAALFSGTLSGAACVEAAFVSRSPGVLCGLPVVEELFHRHAPQVVLESVLTDGARLEPREAFLTARGKAGEVLPLERIALNFLQRLSGIATLTRRFVDQVSGTGAVLLDTRKTTPGWRWLEKYAVRSGGGTNHRMSLSDAVLLKDNHLGVLRALGLGSIPEWIDTARRSAPGSFLEIEVEGREDFLVALGAGPDAILLDNFDIEGIRWAVGKRNERGSTPLLEASGGLQLERVWEVAQSGVDRISVGALTHSAPALDIGLDLVRAYREEQ